MEGTLMKFFSKTMKLNNIDTVPYLTYNSLSEIKFINLFTRYQPSHIY